MKIWILVLVLSAAVWARAEMVQSSSSIDDCAFDLRGLRELALTPGEELPGCAWNNTADWTRGGDAGGTAVTVRRVQVNPVSGAAIGEPVTLGGGAGEGVTAGATAAFGRWRYELVQDDAVRASATFTCVGTVATTEVASVSLDTRTVAVRAIGTSADDLFAFAHNNTSTWRCGGDGAADAATIRLTEMDALGVTNNPSGWTETAAVTNLICTGSEGLLAWTADRKAFFRADLLVGSATNGTAYFDFSQAQDAGLLKTISCLKSEQTDFTIVYSGGTYHVSGLVRDGAGNVLTEGVDYRLEVTSPGAGLPTSVTVIGLGAWRGRAEVPLAAREIVMSSAAVSGVACDLRLDVDGARVVDGAAELLPLARTNAKDWRMGGLGAEPSATLAVTPAIPVKADGKTVWFPVGTRETLVTSGGEAVYTGWAPTGTYYEVTLTTNSVTIARAVVDLTGGAAREYGAVTLENGNWPALGKELTVSVTDAAGVSQGATPATWTRTSPDKATTTVVAAKAASYKPTADDLEQWLTVSVGGTEGTAPVFTQTFWFSKLPVVYVTTSDGQWPTANKEDHSGSFRLQGNAKWKQDKVLYDGELEKIHVRGNTTSGYPKKPYKLKLGKKGDLLGMGKNKHWVLLANWNDPGLMRNKTAYDLSAELGCTAMASEWVDVIFNGQFVGNYQLCEHIRIDSTRIDINNWEDTAEETAIALAAALIPEEGKAQDALADGLTDSMTANLAWLTTGLHTFTNGITYTLIDYGIDVTTFDLSGGYVYELDRFADELSMFRVTTGKIQDTLIKVNSPETLYTNTQLLNEQQTRWTEFFASVQTENGYANGKSWTERGDVKSMAAYWLSQVIMSQIDQSWSRYAYKPQGKPIAFGPVWDFDHAVGGRAQTWTVSTNAEGVVTTLTQPNTSTGWRNGVATVSGYAGDNFYPLWVDDPYFCLALYEIWQAHRDYLFGLVEDGGTLDDNYDYLLESARANDAIWPVQTAGNATFPFDGEQGNAKVMKRCLKDQIEWIDTQMTSLRTLVASLKSTASDHPYTDSADKLKMAFPTALARPGSVEGATPDVVARQGEDVAGTVAVSDANTATVEVYVNGIAVSTNVVANRAVSYEIPARFFTAETGHRNLVALLSRNSSGTLRHTTYALVETADAEHFPLVGSDLVVEVGPYVFDPKNPDAGPAVTVATTNGVTLVEGRDYAVSFIFKADGTAEAIVTGLGNASGTGLAEGQINFVGTVKKSFLADRVAAGAAQAAALDTRAFDPRRPVSGSEVLPFAYDTAWWAGDVSSVSSVIVVPFTNGAPETARQVAVAVTNAVGTGVWVPTHRELYRAEIVPSAGEAMTVFIDLTGAKDLAVFGVVQPNGDIVFTNLCDVAGTEKTLTLPKQWLDETGVDVEVARDTAQKGANGLPVWESYVLGLEPNGEPVRLAATIVPEGEGFRVTAEELKAVRTELVEVKYELWSTEELGTDFGLYRSGQTATAFGELPKDGPQRFYRAKAKVFWK